MHRLFVGMSNRLYGVDTTSPYGDGLGGSVDRQCFVSSAGHQAP